MTRKYRVNKTSSDKMQASCSLMMAGDSSQAAARVQRGAGKWSNGLITDPAVISRGEALGHYFWIDHEMLQSVASAMMAAGTTGIKSRLGHPSWSDDKTGMSLGRFVGGRLDGDTVRASGLHLSGAASKSPSGDLAGWLLSQAEEDPGAIGISIEFEHDYEAEIAFLEQHGATWQEDRFGRYLDLETFVSPDPLNVNNLPHGRLQKLRAIDVVDTPASNPDGLLSEAERLGQAAEYILSLSDERPEGLSELPTDALRERVALMLSEKGLSIGAGDMPQQTQMKDGRNNPAPATEPTQEPTTTEPGAQEPATEPVATTEPAVEEPATEPAAQPAAAAAPVPAEGSQLSAAQSLVKQYQDRFGAKGLEYLSAGLDLDAAQGRFNAEMLSQNQELTQKLAAVGAAGGSLGDERGVSHSPAGGISQKPKRNGLTGLTAVLSESVSINGRAHRQQPAAN